jgi:ABC-type transport system substrate-binding protein
MVLPTYPFYADKTRKENEKDLKNKVLILLMLVSLVAMLPLIPNVRAQSTRGPIMDVLRHTVIRTPEAARIAMLGDQGDMSPDQIRTSDVEVQAAAGMLVTQNLGFHMGYIAYNIRPLSWVNAEYRSGVTYWPLHDVEFRHALVHCYDQLAIIPPIYGYIVTPVRSLVPPAQSKYYDSNVPAHPYNPGDPFTHAAGTSCGILWDAGYRFVDADSSSTVTDADYWKMPNNDPLDEYVIWTPLATDAPTSFEHGAEFVNDLASIGLASTSANGNSGMINVGRDFNTYLDIVYGTATTAGGMFDAYMVFHSLTRVPSQLYGFLHTSQDSNTPGQWGLSNGPGVNNGTIDELTEVCRFGIDPDDIEVAAKEVQSMLYTPDKGVYPDADDFALAYMLLYSRSLFNVFGQRMKGAVRSPGYGSDNTFTFLKADFKTGQERLEAGKKVMIYINGLPPASLNPTFASTVYEFNIIGSALDGMTAVNPFNHYDIPWIATDWVITEKSWGMEVEYTLRTDVTWQDGRAFDAYEAEFSWEALRDYESINWMDSSNQLIDAVAVDADTVIVNSSRAGLSLFYSFSGSGAILPPQIYDRPWDTGSLPHITAYQPEQHAYGTDMAPTYSAITPHKVPTNLFGTGPWIFQTYNPTAESDDMWANREYFLTQAEVDALMYDMFWEIGDYTKSTDGIINVVDLTYVSFVFGKIKDVDPEYDAQADFNSDGIIDTKDVSECSFHLLWQRTYASP